MSFINIELIPEHKKSTTFPFSPHVPIEIDYEFMKHENVRVKVSYTLIYTYTGCLFSKVQEFLVTQEVPLR